MNADPTAPHCPAAPAERVVEHHVNVDLVAGGHLAALWVTDNPGGLAGLPCMGAAKYYRCVSCSRLIRQAAAASPTMSAANTTQWVQHQGIRRTCSDALGGVEQAGSQVYGSGDRRSEVERAGRDHQHDQQQPDL